MPITTMISGVENCAFKGDEAVVKNKNDNAIKVHLYTIIGSETTKWIC